MSKDTSRPGSGTGPRARPTLADIARELGLSEATVSRGLRGNPEINEQTRERIRRAAQELGYVPNAAARSLVRRSSRTLGLLVPDVTDPLHAQIVAGFSRCADRLGYTMLVMDGACDPARRERGLQTLIEHQVDGVALCSTPVSLPDTIARMRPTLCAFISPEGSDADLRAPGPLGRIRADDAAGIGLLVAHLLERGLRRLSWVNGPDNASNRLRRAAVCRALEAAGIEPRIREYLPGDSQDAAGAGYARIAALVARERPDALLCYDDKMALTLLDALRRAGLSVPGDLVVTGFDGISFAAISNPGLTTVVQPAEAMGERAATALVAAVEAGTPLEDQTLEVSLAIRESSARAQADRATSAGLVIPENLRSRPDSGQGDF